MTDKSRKEETPIRTLTLLLLLLPLALAACLPSATPTPTASPVPTWTPEPTWTPTPAPTWTPEPPAATATPTTTPAQAPTATPDPTSTPAPSPTPRPTATATPTPTPEPTPTPDLVAQYIEDICAGKPSFNVTTSSFSELEEKFQAYAEYLKTVSVPDQVVDHYNAQVHAADVVVSNLARAAETRPNGRPAGNLNDYIGFLWSHPEAYERITGIDVPCF